MAEYLEDEEVVERIRAWWRENGVSLVGSIVLVLGGWGGWNWYGGYVERQSEESFIRFYDYVTLRESGEGQGEEAIALLAELDEGYSSSGGHVLSLLYRASDAVQDEDFPAAIQHLEAALDTSPQRQVEALVRLRLARVYLQQEAYDAALNMLDGIDDAGYVSVREELRGDVHLALGQGESARVAYQSAIEAEDATTTGMAWPFLSMKRFGFAFDEPVTETGVAKAEVEVAEIEATRTDVSESLAEADDSAELPGAPTE